VWRLNQSKAVEIIEKLRVLSSSRYHVVVHHVL